MDEPRWPKCALPTMLENPTRFMCLKDVNQMREDYNITNECFAKKHPHSWIRRRVKKVDRNMRRNNIRIRCSNELVKEERLTKAIYQSYPKELWTRQARMGDWYSIFGAGIPDKCPICDQQFRCPIQHIVRTCGTYDIHAVSGTMKRQSPRKSRPLRYHRYPNGSRIIPTQK